MTGDNAWRIVELNGIADPTWDQVRAAIEALDNKKNSCLSVEAANGDLLLIAGGAGRYHAEIHPGVESPNYDYDSREPAGVLLNPAGSAEVRESLIVDGIDTELPERAIVDRETVFKAAERFFRDGAFEPTLVWERW